MLKHKIGNHFIHIVLRLLSNNTSIQIIIVHKIMQFTRGPPKLCNSGPTKEQKEKKYMKERLKERVERLREIGGKREGE